MPLPLIHYLYRSGLPKYLRQHDNGEPSWALVTGASDGIGRALCTELSKRGFNVVLHGRNASKLARVRDELQAMYPQRHFRVVTADAASFTQADIDRIAAEVANVPLTILINNVGGTSVLSSNFKHFEDTTPAEMEALFSLNVLFPLELTRTLLPRLQQQEPTLIMTCGSQSHVGQPYIATYSATKGAVHTWMRALAAELYSEGSQVEVLEVLIGATYTQQFESDSNFAPGLFMPTAQVMAQAALARVGLGHRSVCGYFWHGVQTFFLYLLPVTIADNLVASILKPSIKYAALDPHSALNLPKERVRMRSNLSDPNHPMYSGNLVDLVTGGVLKTTGQTWDPGYARDDQNEWSQSSSADPATHAPYSGRGGFGEGRGRGGFGSDDIGGGRGAFLKKTLQEDALYLLIVDMPSESELEEARQLVGRD